MDLRRLPPAAAAAGALCLIILSALAQSQNSPGGPSGNPATNSGSIAAVPPLTLTCAAFKGQIGVAYNSSLVASGGVPPYTYSISSGSLPPALSLNASTGAIIGTPTTAGIFKFTAKVVDSSGNPAANTVTSDCSIIIDPPPLSLTCPENTAQVGVAYNSSLVASSGLGPYTYSISAGSLPTGLTLNASTGAIAGIPSNAGAFNFTAKVVDSSFVTSQSAMAACTVAVAPTAPTSIESVEVTQAIQQYQTLSQLQQSLGANGQPPVPIIKGKPAVLRVYLKPVAGYTKYIVRALITWQTVSGSTRQILAEDKPVLHLPGCGPQEQRRRTGGCRSHNFFFTPYPDNLKISVQVLDRDSKPLEPVVDLQFKNLADPKRLLLYPVQICDEDPGAFKKWNCSDPGVFAKQVDLMRLLFPTADVEVESPLGLAKSAPTRSLGTDR